MNTNKTSRLVTRSAAATACLGAVLAGATACGNDDATTTASPQLGHQAAQGVGAPAPASKELAEKARANIWEYMYQPASKDLAEKAKANIWEYTYQLKAQRPDAARPTPGFGDDRRQSIQEARDRHAPAPSHAPGYNKALPSEW